MGALTCTFQAEVGVGWGLVQEELEGQCVQGNLELQIMFQMTQGLIRIKGSLFVALSR